MHAKQDYKFDTQGPDNIRGGRFWKLKAALKGTRKASYHWQELSPQHTRDIGFDKHDVNPCVYYHANRSLYAEQHGDVFLNEGVMRAWLWAKRV